MVAACAVARQKFAASSNGVGSRTSSEAHRPSPSCFFDAASLGATFGSDVFGRDVLGRDVLGRDVLGRDVPWRDVLWARRPWAQRSKRPLVRSSADEVRSRHPEVFQQRQDADDDDDDAHDLLGAAVDRQHVDEIENENDDEERDENADENGRDRSAAVLVAINRGYANAAAQCRPGCTSTNRFRFGSAATIVARRRERAPEWVPRRSTVWVAF